MPSSGAASAHLSPWRRAWTDPVRADGAALLLWLPGLLSAVLLGWGAAHPEAWPLSLAALVTLSLVVLATERRSAWLGAVSVLLASAGWTWSGMGWAALAVRDGSHVLAWQAAVLAILLLVQLTPLLAVWWLLGWATRRPGQSGRARAPAIIIGRWVLSLACAETLRQWGWWGSGYASLAAAFVEAPGASFWVPLMGATGWATLVAAVAGGLALAAWQTLAGAGATARRVLLCTAAVAAGIAACPAGAWTREREGPAIEAWVVPSPLPRGARWSVKARDEALARLAQAIGQAAPGSLIVTSETYFPEPPPREAKGAWGDLLKRVTAAKVHVLLGMPHVLRDFDGLHLMNAVLQLSPERVSLYAKERLVPGGEYLPWSEVLGPVYAQMFDNVRTGQRSGPDELTAALFVAGESVGASICHELGFSLTMARRAEGVGWLANLADDAWIDSALYRQQMVSIARLRALETGRPLLRASHGGPSVLVGPDGQVRARSSAGQDTPWRVQWHAVEGHTPYQQAARWWASLPLACAALWAAWCAWFRSSSSKATTP